MQKINQVFILLLITIVLTSCGQRFQKNAAEVFFKPGEETIDLYGTYDQNDLLILTKEETYNGVALEIPQIDGLKNKDVEKKVNQDIQNRVQRGYKTIPNLQYVTYGTVSNFCNIVSIGVYMGGEGENSQKQVRLNYNLVNGEPLTFEEMFTPSADTLAMIRNAFRQELIRTSWEGRYDENKLYKMVKTFYESEEKSFQVSTKEIYIYYEGYSASISMMEHADKITIYSRYVTKESLYERDDIGKKNIFTCVEIPEEAFDVYEFGYLEDNFWRDFACYEEYFDESDADPHLQEYLDFKEFIHEDIRKQIETYRIEAKKNPDKVYIFTSKPNIYRVVETEWRQGEWQESYVDIACVNRQIYVFEMSKELFENTYKDRLIQAYRYEYLALQGGISLEVIEGVTVRELCADEYFNYVTKESVTYETN